MALPRDEQNVPQTSKLEDIFYCAARRRRLPLSKCLDDYMNTNAMTLRSRVCYRCPQGRANRLAFAEGRPLD